MIYITGGYRTLGYRLQGLQDSRIWMTGGYRILGHSLQMVTGPYDIDYRWLTGPYDIDYRGLQEPMIQITGGYRTL